MTRKILTLLLAAALTMPLAAQEEATSTETSTDATTTTTTTSTTAKKAAANPGEQGAETEVIEEPAPASARRTREELFGILERLPPQVAKALKLDPSLWTNQSYLATYPLLADFAKQHPEVAYHTAYYFDNVYIPGDAPPESPGVRMWNHMIEVASIFVMVFTFISLFLWLIRMILDYRRWSRQSRVHTEVHTKLLDRFGTNEELMAYMKTDAGRRFLEAAPIAVDAGAPPRQPIAAPLSRVLWSVQAGVVLAFAGLGLTLVSARVTEKEVAEPLAAFGTLGLFIGFGFVAAAVISFILSRKLGLLRDTQPIGDTNVEVTSE